MNKKEWLKDKDSYKLCYIENSFAYFTNIPLSEQWGDDWDDAPYEHNAGEPYSENPDQIIKIAYDGYDIDLPSDRTSSYYSVKEINSGAIAWLVGNNYEEDKVIAIQAGCNPEKFIEKIQSLNGELYVKLD